MTDFVLSSHRDNTHLAEATVLWGRGGGGCWSWPKRWGDLLFHLHLVHHLPCHIRVHAAVFRAARATVFLSWSLRGSRSDKSWASVCRGWVSRKEYVRANSCSRLSSFGATAAAPALPAISPAPASPEPDAGARSSLGVMRSPIGTSKAICARVECGECQIQVLRQQGCNSLCPRNK